MIKQIPEVGSGGFLWTYVGSLFLGATLALTLSMAAHASSAIPEIIDVPAIQLDKPDGALLVDLQTQFRDELSTGKLDPAQETAKQIVAICSTLWGESSPQVAAALTNLAIAQSDRGNFDAARQNFLGAIRIRERVSSSIIEPLLINPIRGLAASNLALDNAEVAVPLYERAIHVSHVNMGPNNLQQLDDMDALSRAYYSLGETRAANKVQDNMFRLQQRRFDQDSDQYLDALIRRARWYNTVTDTESSSRAYGRVIQAMTRAYGENDKRIITPLVEFAFITPEELRQDSMTTEEAIFDARKRAISRAVRIARTHGARDPALLAQTLTKKGDFYMSSGATRQARIPYKEAWQITSETPTLLPLREQLFGQPKAVRLVPIRRTLKNIGADSNKVTLYQERGFVEVVFDVSTFGRPVNLRVVDSQPAGVVMDNLVVRKLRGFKYRPMFKDGLPTETLGLRYRHEFRYSEERLTPGQRETREETEAARANVREANSAETSPVTIDDAVIETMPEAETASDADAAQATPLDD